MMKSNIRRLSALVVGALVFASATGCNQSDTKYIDKVVVTPSADLTTLQVALVFTDKLKVTNSGKFNVSKYGTAFMNGYTSSSPFEVGFDLNTSIVNDQNYVNLKPTTTLPNGMGTGIPNPVVEIKPDQSISPIFNLSAYADVLKLTWVGVSATFNVDLGDFPAGLQLNTSFLPDASGNPGIVTSVFGPVTNSDGTLTTQPGIAVFANIKALMHHMALEPGKATEFQPTSEIVTPIPAR